MHSLTPAIIVNPDIDPTITKRLYRKQFLLQEVLAIISIFVNIVFLVYVFASLPFTETVITGYSWSVDDPFTLSKDTVERVHLFPVVVSLALFVLIGVLFFESRRSVPIRACRRYPEMFKPSELLDGYIIANGLSENSLWRAASLESSARKREEEILQLENAPGRTQKQDCQMHNLHDSVDDIRTLIAQILVNENLD